MRVREYVQDPLRPSPSCTWRSARTVIRSLPVRQKLIDTEGRVERFTKKFGAQTSESRKKAEKAKKGHSTASSLGLGAQA